MRLLITLIAILIYITPSYARMGRKKVTPLILQGREAQAYAYADSVIAKLTDTEMLAQLIMPMVWPTEESKGLLAWDDMVMNKKFGGVLFQKGDPRVQLAMTNRMRAKARIPMLVAADGEWGLSMRLSNTLRYPKNMLVGAVGDADLTQRYGNAVAYEMKRIGIHINFAPTIDVNNNPKNPVIGVRSFGSIPHSVALLGTAYSVGLEERGVLSCAKHFPGHGNTDVDSHHGLPTIKGTRQSLEATELAPFRRYIERGLGAVMVGHLKVPALNTGNRPTSLSRAVVTDLLRREMGFGGLIVTDGLAMEGVLTDKSLSVAVEAFKAGNHILLAAKDPAKDLRELSQALQRGEISRRDLVERCREVLAMKWAVGAHIATPIPTADLYKELAPVGHKSLIEQLNNRAMTLLKNKRDVLPLRPSVKTALLRYGSEPCEVLASSLRKHNKADHFTITPKMSKPERDKIYKQLKGYATVIIAITSDKLTPDVGMIDLVQRVPTILTLLSSPYTLLSFERILPHIDAITVGYETTEGTQRAMAQALLGGIPFRGKLPVDLSPLYQAGSGEQTVATRLGEALPETVGLSSERLAEIDRLALEGIRKGAYPGCQVLVAKDGQVVYNKAFGTKDAAHREKVTTETLYDLASVTKATATVPLLMIAADDGMLDPEDPIGPHLSYIQGSDKERVKIAELLHHIGGMPASIPFYHLLIDHDSYKAPLTSNRRKAGYTIRIGERRYARSSFKFRPDMVSKDSSALYPIRFAAGMYLPEGVRDSIRLAMRDAKVSIPRQGFRYSDIDFLLLQDILEGMHGATLDVLFDRQLAQPLGLSRLLYKPYIRFAPEEIAEGQKDRFLRHTTLRGDVDDEAAAMLGGVSGNAGLYGNAESLAVLLQMYLNMGTYGGRRLIDEETVRRFTTTLHTKSPYSLGFYTNKEREERGAMAMSASPTTYGHLGFTGTCFWVDPERHIIFIFLSNRVAPTRWNSTLSDLRLRPEIHEAVYQALLD